jgi:DNA (cytosine-5)-methyltransferase 1
MSRSLKFIDLFAGAGGMSLGFKSNGCQLLFANEYDEAASNTLKSNTSNGLVVMAPIEMLVEQALGGKVEINNNGRKVISTGVAKVAMESNKRKADLKAIEELSKLDFSNVDVIVGGPPCQGFSTAGRGKKGSRQERLEQFLDDPRNQLFRYFLEVVSYYKPKAIVIENVKGLLSASTYSQEIIAACDDLGYYIGEPLQYNAADFGIPQARQRVFFVAFRYEKDDSNSLFGATTKFESFKDVMSTLKEDKVSLKEAIGDLPIIRSNPHRLNLAPKNELPIPTIEEQFKLDMPTSFGEFESTLNYGEIVDLDKQSKYVKDINGSFSHEYHEKKLFNHKSRYQNDRDLEIYKMLVPGKYLTHKSNKRALEACPYDVGTFADKYFKLDPDKPSKTVVAHLSNDNNAYVHYGNIPRGITPREAARIQSFPDHYKFYGSQGAQFKQIGNAVPPKLAKKIASALALVLHSEESNK